MRRRGPGGSTLPPIRTEGVVVLVEVCYGSTALHSGHPIAYERVGICGLDVGGQNGLRRSRYRAPESRPMGCVATPVQCGAGPRGAQVQLIGLAAIRLAAARDVPPADSVRWPRAVLQNVLDPLRPPATKGPRRGLVSVGVFGLSIRYRDAARDLPPRPRIGYHRRLQNAVLTPAPPATKCPSLLPFFMS
jgi:hypothetical protein